MKQIKQFFQRRIALLLALVMAISMLPISTFAAEMPTEESAAPAAIPDQAMPMSTTYSEGGLEYTLYDDHAEVTGYSGSATELVIPDQIDGVPVTTIGAYAFYDCDALTSIDLPDGLTTIGYAAFNYCDNLTSVVIPAAVTNIGTYAFGSCSNLHTITVSPQNTIYSSIDGILYRDAGTRLVCCPGGRSGSVSIPAGVVEIEASAFSNCAGLTSVTIPASVTSIEWDTFYNCTSLEAVEIPESVTSIGDFAFDNCTSLKAVEIPDSVTSIGSYAFYNCDSLTSVVIPDSVTSIGGSVYASCDNLTSIEWSSASNDIPWYAFGNCRNLTALTIPNSVTTITYGATWNCDNLSDVYYDGTKDEWSLVSIDARNTGIENATIHFNDCTCTVCGDTSAVIAAPVLSCANVASTGKIKLTWDKVDGAAQYQVYRATSKTGTYSLMKTTTGTSYTNTSAKAGTTYYYYVVAVSEDGTKSEPSSIVSRTCDLAQPVVTGSNVTSTGKIKLIWDKVDDAVNYEVYRSTTGKDGSWTLMKTTADTSYTNTSAKAGVRYYYKVRAIASKSAANSAYSSVINRTCDLAQPVASISNVASTGKIQLTWEAVDGAVSYKVYRSTTGKDGSWTLSKTTTGTSYTNTSAEAGKAYYYKVRAIAENEAANSAYSSVKSRTCDLARPDVSITRNSSGKPKLSWDAVDGAVSYKVYRSTSKTGTYSLLKTTTSTSFTNTSAVAGTTYYYKVVAVHTKSAANSAYSSVVSIQSK